MAYPELLEENDGVDAQFLFVLTPSRQVSEFTLETGDVYYAEFDFGYVAGFTLNGVAFTRAATPDIIAPGEFYFDESLNRLYFEKPDSSPPSDITDFFVVDYELYVGTFDAQWNRDPTDENSGIVYFEPVVKSSPNIQASITDILFGVLPTLTTSIDLINAEHIFEKHFYDSSFCGKEIRVYHWLNELSTENIKLVFKGKTGNIDYTGGSASITVTDGTTIFGNEYRSKGTQFFNTADFPKLDPKFSGKPIRTVYGQVNGFVPANVSYVQDSPLTTDNREWIVRAEGAKSAAIVSTVVGSSSTVTTTFLNSVAGICAGDYVWFDKTTDEYRLVINVGANFITHAALVSGVPTAGDTVKRGNIGVMHIVQGTKKFFMRYGRDWVESVDATTGALKFTLSSSIETTFAMPETFSPADQLFCRVYGKPNDVTLDGSPFGVTSPTYGALTNPLVILVDILKSQVGLTDDDLDIDRFTDLLPQITDEVGFAVPALSSDDYPSIKNVILSLLESTLLKVSINFDSLWTASQLSPIVDTDKDIDQDETLLGSIKYTFDYTDVYSDFIVNYGIQEMTDNGTSFQPSVSAQSQVAALVHGISKTYNATSLHIDPTGAALLATRLSYALGDRQGSYSLVSKNRFFNNVIGDNISVTTPKLPGFPYNPKLERSRKFTVNQIEKSLTAVRMILGDQKGVQDFSGQWG